MSHSRASKIPERSVISILTRHRRMASFASEVMGIAALWLSIAWCGHAATYYVDASRNDDSGEGSSWNTAKKTIQAAVNLTVAGDTVLVTNGVYNTGTTLTPGYALKNRVVITNNITVRSINGPGATIIEGSGTNWFNTSSAVRCVFLAKGVLAGFTLCKGATFGTGLGSSDSYERNGGGVLMDESTDGAVVTNCVIAGCMAFNGGGSCNGTLNDCTLTGNISIYDGGGSCYGTLSNAILAGNTASYGGGAFYGTLSKCTLTGNTSSDGGGAYYCTLYNCTLSSNNAWAGGGSYDGLLINCTISGNSATNYGGGAYYGTLSNCTLIGNASWEGGGACGCTLYSSTLSGNDAWRGGGAFNCTMQNALLAGNTAAYGGGSSYCTLFNCSITGNTATDEGGGVFNCMMYNAVVWSNWKSDGEVDNHASSTLYYSCTTPLPPGVGNISADPQFVDAQNLNLRTTSPCIDVGENAYVSTEDDLAGNPRVQNGVVDMGAYEGGFHATAIPVFDPPTGTRFHDELDVTVSCATVGAVIHYTLDGSEPGETNEIYEVALRLTGSAAVRARAYKAGLAAAQAQAVYTQSVTDPVISPAAGTVGTNALTVTITCATAGAVIRYTLDGTEPSETSPAYTNAITLTASATVQAKAFKPGLEPSRTVASDFAVIQAVATPVFNPPSQTIATNSLTVVITCAPPWASIRYTLDGSDPTTENGNSYWGQIVLTQSATVKARAFYYDMADSAVATADYTVLQTIAAPVLLPADGTIFTGLRKVTMSCATAGVEIHFTTNGIEPTRSSSRYTGPFNISKTTAFRVKAFKDGMADSPTVTATYYTLSPLSEALDVTNLVVTTYTWAPWLPQATVTHDGADAAQSGVIRDNGSTRMEARVTGPGTLSFWWKVSCEDDPDADNWDYLGFAVDYAERGRIDGTTDWARVVCTLAAGTHTVAWEYRKDESVSVGADCGWVDQLSFIPGNATATSTTPVPVPYAWLDQYPVLLSLAGGSYEAAALADADGDGHEAWQEYVTGSVPTNSESTLHALIAVSNGMPWIAWSPDLGTARVYTVEGSANLTGSAWGPTNAGNRFFRVKVDMP